MRPKGFATPVTLVVLTLALVALMAATSQLVLSGLRGVVGEVRSYRALALAESALDAFPVLVQQGECGQTAWPTSYTATLEGSTVSAAYAVNPSGNIASGEVTVTATATLGEATARVRRVYTVSCGITGAVPAALTSRPAIRVSGDAQILSETLTATSSGLIPRNFPTGGLTTATESKELPTDANNPTFTLQVTDAALIPTGGYVQLQVGSGSPPPVETFKVESKSGNMLTLKRLGNFATPRTVPNGAKLALVEYGVVSYTGSGNSGTLTLHDARGLVTGQRIAVGNHLGTVTSVNTQTNQVNVNWITNPPSGQGWATSAPTSIAEGTPLRAEVLGAASANAITQNGNNATITSSQANSPLVPSQPDELFQRVFGMSKTAFQSLYADRTVSAANFGGNLGNNWELRVVQGNLSLSGNTRICGKGILVVFGNLSVNGSCSSGFQGLIYVVGDYDQQGNATLTGAVVVEGVANLQGCNGEECRTDIAGTGQGDGKIEYDPIVFLRLKLEGSKKPALAAKAGSWRRL